MLVLVLVALALLVSHCGKAKNQTLDAANSLDWRTADACAGVQAQDVAPFANGAVSQQREASPKRTGCVFVDAAGADRFSGALVYIGYDPRDLTLLTQRQGPPPARAWQRQIKLDGSTALVVAETADNCQVILPLSGEQDGWGVRFELAPNRPAPEAQACAAHLPVLEKAVRGLPDLLRAPDSPATAPSVGPASQGLAESCAQFRSVGARASAMTLPLLDAAGKALSPDSAKAMRISKDAAAEGLLDSAIATRRLAARPIPAQLRTELNLYARNADLFRQKLLGPPQTGETYLRLALAVQVNQAKALTFCPAE
ncbi:hypothetical protein Srot_1938 [Segniliparus rotundus DSM 44985]|uniref:Uncharacterized protein n=1 Tax=Segniliparus rotundus (strain ATCC BAA-972 / CDC 1076 / CIP 108378 / DSM 44985 / JCM 13578) TaxID=640132 RepID=D6Z8W6_SEGRD|nr:hypothetical protein Srot_1938 [Segniliparus rotundus DSM 44985]